MYIANVENSEIDVSGIRTVLVQGDSAYPSIRFVLDPTLTGLSWRVRGTYLSSNIAVTSPELVATETASSVALDWSVASDFTTYSGEMQLSLVGSNELGTVITKALGEITIQKDYSLGEHQTITLDLFEQLMAQADATISKYPYIDEVSGNWYVWNPTLGEWEDTGESANGAPSYWYTGTTITGTETTPTAFPSSGITAARYGDMYLNEETSNVYRCTSGGDAATALWSCRTNIKGAQGEQGIQGEQGLQGEQGVQGIQGIQGDPGTDGVGVPAGGTANQVLSKIDGTDHNDQWVTLTPALAGLEGVSEVDAIDDDDEIVLNDATASTGEKTKYVLWSAINTALGALFAAITHASTHGPSETDSLTWLFTLISQITSGGVYSGGAVTAQGTPNQTVAVSAGAIITPEGKPYPFDTADSLEATAADVTNPRIDIVYVSDVGVVTYLAGTAAGSPAQPSTPANGTILAAIARAANDNTIATADITDQRDFITIASDFEDVNTVTENSNAFACDLAKKHTKNFSFSITNTTGKTVTFTNVPYGTCDVILTIKATGTAAVTWTLDGRTLVWPAGAPTLTSGYTYDILFSYSPLLGKWVGRAQAGAAN